MDNRKVKIVKFFKKKNYPDAKDPTKVGTYDSYAFSGGGYFYDDVLEYRVWVHPKKGEVYFQPFSSYEDAMKFSKKTEDAEPPLVLVRQNEHIDEPEEGRFVHIKKPRVTEWQVDWLQGSHGSQRQIPDFLKKHGHTKI